MGDAGLALRAALSAALVLLALLAGAAGAAAQVPGSSATGDDTPGPFGFGSSTEVEGEAGTSPTSVPGGFPDKPSDYAIAAPAALEAADEDPKIIERKEELGPGDELTASIEAEAVRTWEVGYFRGDEKVNLVVVDATSGEVTESWTGSAVAWPMARGKRGPVRPRAERALRLAAAGGDLPARAVRLPAAGASGSTSTCSCCSASGSARRSSTRPRSALSVPLVLPAARLPAGADALDRLPRAGAAGASRRRAAPERADRVLAIAVVRPDRRSGSPLNIADSGVIDVGYAGVIGADQITHAEPIYGEDAFPEDNPTGDTYGPANYYAYVPFEAALPWSGEWDELPAAHAAAIFFDLATVVGLFVLGRALVRRREGGDPRRGRRCRVPRRLARLVPRIPADTQGTWSA